MSFEDRLRDDLHGVTVPALRVPDRLADQALAGARRQTRVRAVAIAGVVTAVGAALPVVWSVLPGGPAAVPATGPSCAAGAPSVGPVVTLPTVDVAAAPAYPRPGGGPRVIEAFSSQAGTHLLDPVTGTYVAVPWPVLVSPDGFRVAINDDGRIGVADRTELITSSAAAVTWIEPQGSFPQWSPDGTALLFSVVDRTGDSITYTLHRYDVATATTTPTGYVDATTVIGGVGWAADSQHYLVRLRATDGAGILGPLQYLNPDGSTGPRLDVPGGTVGGAEAYSPSGRYAILDGRLMVDEPVCTRILDVTTGETAAVLGRGESVIGWYDDTAFLRFDAYGQRLQVVAVDTLAVVKEIDLAASPGVMPVQIGDSAILAGTSMDLGF